MARHLPYKIIRRGTAFTAAGPTPDRVLSQHYSLETAQRAFARVSGPAILVGPGNIQLDHRIL